ncbi:MAG TPA: hypothetical protein VEJ41_02975 [Candidatus Acidoferrales bacterium]|nr:hypothetical protein [Candidatus Acidoferrales bacterium]
MSMQPPKRQIIKTRSQRPYIAARIVVVIIVLAAIAIAAFELLKPHAGHALGAEPVTYVLRQEAFGAGRRAAVRLMGATRS